MTYEEVLKRAREMGLNCRVCQECSGIVCRGEVPGVGAKGSGKSFSNCVSYLRGVDINLDAVYESRGQDTSCSMFGRKWSMPVFGAPVGGAVFNYGCKTVTDDELTASQVGGAAAAGTAAFTPDGPWDEYFASGLRAAAGTGSMFIPTIKPWKNEKVIENLRLAEASGAIAAAMDVDSAGLINLKLLGKPVDPKSPTDIKEIAAATKLPFIVKGVMTPRAALISRDAGAYGIVVSSHGGRVLEDAPPTCSVLPGIREAVGPDFRIFVDGGIRSGADVFKALALGADAVLIGRPYTLAALAGGAEGAKLYFEKIRAELQDVMVMAGCAALSDITREKVIVHE
jgi:4-hydroxymandelate oxidase